MFIEEDLFSRFCSFTTNGDVLKAISASLAELICYGCLGYVLDIARKWILGCMNVRIYCKFPADASQSIIIYHLRVIVS